MIKVGYEVIETVTGSGSFAGIRSCGIKGTDYLTDGVLEIPMVSCDNDFAERVAAILTENQVSLLHAADVVRDLMNGIFMQR